MNDQVYLRTVTTKKPLKIVGMCLASGGIISHIDLEYVTEMEATKMSRHAAAIYVDFFRLENPTSEIEIAETPWPMIDKTLSLSSATSKQIIGEQRRRQQRAEAAKIAAQPLASSGESDLATSDMFPGEGKDALFSQNWNL